MQHDPYSAFSDAFIARTKSMREAGKRTQEDVAIALGIPLETYKKYEKRSTMPLHLLERFIAIVRGDLVLLITGKEQKARRRLRAKGSGAAPDPE